ncbi:TrmH family RNA methyltransferase [Calderihabitans maritimus]|uniref:TrmH family RNA methyltransferase n=1 Tax=Calderihabitans maritimus TaxID=1246530 RepID=A0A1Z5HS73_9FIRM|nr:RNA methyltransferase [Calderihabitans maritimus]GAW92288.1 TrmH family RNA methyltransferase [Calderihabitans maritimus]
MKILTSRQNPLIKLVAALQKRKKREETGKFVIEGIRMLEEALVSSVAFDFVLYSPEVGKTSRGKKLLEEIEKKNIKSYPVEDNLFRKLCRTENPQGILAVLYQKNSNLSQIFRIRPGILLIADGVQDPGNLGTMIRTADAVSASGVVATEGTVDFYNDKVLRATMGSVFRIPLIRVATGELIKVLRPAGIKLAVAHVAAKTDYWDVNLKPPVALAVGNENSGPSKVLLQEADILVKIPLPGRAESLNAAIAAALLLYEVVRQSKEV